MREGEVEPQSTILVQVDRMKACQARIDGPIGLALRHETHLAGLYLMVGPTGPSFARGYLPPEHLWAISARAQAWAEEELARFSAAAERNLRRSSPASTGASTSSWPSTSACTRATRLAVVGQEDPIEPSPGRLPEQAVLGLRPVRTADPHIGAGEDLGQRVAVAWDSSREAARAVQRRAADPEAGVLRSARSSVNPRPATSAMASQRAPTSLSHSAPGGPRSGVQRSRTATSTLATRCSRTSPARRPISGHGGYGHSRLREIMLGGATRTILHDMTVRGDVSHHPSTARSS